MDVSNSINETTPDNSTLNDPESFVNKITNFGTRVV